MSRPLDPHPTLWVYANDVDDPFEIVDAGLMGIVLSPAEFDDGDDGDGWLVLHLYPN